MGSGLEIQLFDGLGVEKKECLIINESEKILNILRYAPHGVIKRCENDGIMSSVNLATVYIEDDETGLNDEDI